MKKIASMVTSLLILMGTPALAGTSAQVEYGTVQESRILTQEARLSRVEHGHCAP